ncbi:MAG: Xaa-Pro aminopeptidase [Saprospiraceae bacterium]|nr:MAG: Xaa-Pro aminopeptidase [Saprospiraceae bacterium]
MAKKGLDAYIVPSHDPHQSEYVADRWKSREWLSGFTGSAGLLVVTAQHAGLWTDSRYFTQAEQQLKGSSIVLHKQRIPHAPEHVSWLVDNLSKGATVGVDGNLFSVSQIRYLAKHFYEKEIDINHDFDLIEEIYKDRSGLPGAEVFEHKLEYAGRSREEKLALIREEMTKKALSFWLVTTLDDIAWVLNLRSADVNFNPLFISYLVIGEEISYLFIQKGKINKELEDELQTAGIFLKEYAEIEPFLQNLSPEKTIAIDPAATSIRLFNAIPEGRSHQEKNLIRQLKAIKTEHEVSHIRQAMVKDGVALTRLFRWLEGELRERAVSEVEVADKLAGFRSQQANYYGESFAAIVGYNANGAIVHYRPEPGKCAMIESKGILLLDSGGQYMDGTTDITRTIALGEPTATQKRHFTLVLKGNIALSMMKFPEGTSGAQLDGFARQYLWQEGLNFGHGTGHGVGYFLNVHEPPQGFATSAVTSRGATPFEPGMFTSNEPGYYEDGKYGIRIENLELCIKVEATDYGQFLAFETLTLFPIDRNLMDMALLTETEKQWLNDYHAKVFEQLSPKLEKEEVAWLAQKCAGL